MQVPAVFLLASEVWEPLASGEPGYKSNDFVVDYPCISTNVDSSSGRESPRDRSPSEVAYPRQLVTPRGTEITSSRFEITAENFFSLARLADKFIIPHLTSLLTYFSHNLIAITKPSYELWLAAARHEMSLVEKTCRNTARLEVARLLAEKGISYFIVEKGINPAAMDGIIMELMKLKDNYIAHRQVRGGIPLALN